VPPALLGGLFYSMTLGEMPAAVVAPLIGLYLWTRRRRNTLDLSSSRCWGSGR